MKPVFYVLKSTFSQISQNERARSTTYAGRRTFSTPPVKKDQILFNTTTLLHGTSIE